MGKGMPMPAGPPPPRQPAVHGRQVKLLRLESPYGSVDGRGSLGPLDVVFKLLVAGFENDFQEFLVSRRATHVLRRAVSFAGQADRTHRAIRGGQNLLQHHVVPPVIPQIVGINDRVTLRLEYGADFRPALIEDVHIVVFEGLRHAPTLVVFLELMKMAVRPAHHNLEGIMETTQTEGAGDLQPSPDRWTNILERSSEFVDQETSLRLGWEVHACALTLSGGQYIAMAKQRQEWPSCTLEDIDRSEMRRIQISESCLPYSGQSRGNDGCKASLADARAGCQWAGSQTWNLVIFAEGKRASTSVAIPTFFGPSNSGAVHGFRGSIDGEVKRKHSSDGRSFSCFQLSLPIIPSESSKAAARGKRRIQIDLYVVMLFDTCARTLVTAPQSGVLRQV